MVSIALLGGPYKRNEQRSDMHEQGVVVVRIHPWAS